MSKVKFNKELDEVCMLMARICLHANEDCPSEYRTRHFKEALDDAVDYLKESDWYKFNVMRGERANE